MSLNYYLAMSSLVSIFILFVFIPVFLFIGLLFRIDIYCY